MGRTSDPQRSQEAGVVSVGDEDTVVLMIGEPWSLTVRGEGEMMHMHAA